MGGSVARAHDAYSDHPMVDGDASAAGGHVSASCGPGAGSVFGPGALESNRQNS
jgi:hypothetical protein